MQNLPKERKSHFDNDDFRMLPLNRDKLLMTTELENHVLKDECQLANMHQNVQVFAVILFEDHLRYVLSQIARLWNHYLKMHS